LKEIKFGVYLAARNQAIGGWRQVADLAIESEKLGYHSFLLGDHLMRHGYRLECWTTLSALSTLTNKIRLGPVVLCNSFRNPAVLAKMAATFDVISDGRLEFGIGVGNNKDEFLSYGFPFPKLGVRVKRLEESLEVIKRLWTHERPSFNGRYYQIREAYCEPKPIQKPHPPIIIGGGNEKYTLKPVASHADVWNFWGPAKEFEKKLSVLKRYCSLLKRNFDEIELSYFSYFVDVDPNEKELEAILKEAYRKGPRTETFKDWFKIVRDNNILGNPDECLSVIQKYLDIGVTYFILRFVDLTKKKDVLKLFIERVAKKTSSI
jgi:alkanesulfonate monooxygenase SsuD/methylene tetrahydromethanopterin reductase-like flavin-dependent oxidoreductase (luciferase family)